VIRPVAHCLNTTPETRGAKIGEISEGANETQRPVIARRLFGREFTG